MLKLQKALHGLKQALRAWNSKLNEVYIWMGFFRRKNDSVVYYVTKVEERLMIGVCVDDLIIIGPNSHRIFQCKKKL